MSYILDALKKADQERSLGSVPDLETPHWVVRRTARSYRWVWVVAGLLLVNGVLLAVLLGRDSDEQQPAAEAIVESTVAEPASRLDPVPAVPVQGGGTTVVTRPRSMARVVQSAPASPPVQRSPQVRSAVPAPVTATADSVPPAAVPEPAATPSLRPGVQLWSDLSLEFRSNFTLPRIDVHVYADQPERRFVLVDLQKYREGDTLANGAVIEEILPQGIQVYFQGTRFMIEK